jgi:putative CocE/NonD family hydrolase
MSRPARRFRLLAALCLAFASAHRSRAEEPYGSVVLRDVRIAMRDGVTLATDVWLPARNGVVADGKFPVVLERTPYDRTESDFWAEAFVPKGYAFVAQDVRGRGASGGRWRPFVDDGNDAVDTAKWLGAQPWFAGKVGTVGISYPGGTQHAMALANMPYLAAMVPIDAVANPGKYGMRHGGAFELRFFNWIFQLGFSRPPLHEPNLDPFAAPALVKTRDDIRAYLRALPLRPGTTPLKHAPDYEAWLVEAMRHGDDDGWWEDNGTGVAAHAADYKDVPVTFVSGWYDSWAAQTANLSYPAIAKAKKSPQRLLMGPWTHGGQQRSYAGQAEFGPDAAIDRAALHLRWFDRWLKGVENGAEKDAPVRIFVMGGGDGHRTADGRVFVGGHWRDEREWPLARAKSTPYYLHAGGTLSPEPPRAAAPTRYVFDPKHPVPTLGGNISSHNGVMDQGAWDQRCRKDFWACEDELPLSARNDVLVFQTAPLERDLEVTGRLVVKLWASSSTPDTDFTAKLVDVYPPSTDFPAGIDLNVGDSIVRARYRDSLAKASPPMQPGRVYPFSIEMYPTSLVFRKGHRIRVDVSSSNFPRFDVNPNTGEPLNENRRWAIAENAISADPEHPSQIVLPVVPAVQ